MKKIMFLLLALISFPLLAQEIVTPTSWGDVTGNLDIYLGSLLGLGLLSIFVSAFINGFLTKASKLLKRIISWIVPIVLSILAAYVLNLGFLKEETIIMVLIYGFAAGLVSNGIFDITTVTTLVKIIQGFLSKKEKNGGA
jgi:uncharacterized membrane protein